MMCRTTAASLRCKTCIYLRRGMGEGLIKRFLNLYCLKLDGSAGSSSLWGVSMRMHGLAPSSDQHFWKTKSNSKPNVISPDLNQASVFSFLGCLFKGKFCPAFSGFTKVYILRSTEDANSHGCRNWASRQVRVTPSVQRKALHGNS